jgi:hypothetical protein
MVNALRLLSFYLSGSQGALGIRTSVFQYGDNVPNLVHDCKSMALPKALQRRDQLSGRWGRFSGSRGVVAGATTAAAGGRPQGRLGVVEEVLIAAAWH